LGRGFARTVAGRRGLGRDEEKRGERQTLLGQQQRKSREIGSGGLNDGRSWGEKAVAGNGVSFILVAWRRVPKICRTSVE